MLKIVYRICCGMDVHKSFIAGLTHEKNIDTKEYKICKLLWYLW